MSNDNQYQEANDLLSEDQKVVVSLSEVCKETIRKWPWLIGSVIICLVVGIVYILITPKTYTEAASLLIKDITEGSSSPAIGDFSSLGLIQNNSNIHNEIETLKSVDLLAEVITRLNLEMNYYVPGKFHKEVAYGKTLPVNVITGELPEDSGLVFDIYIEKNGNIVITNLVLTGPEKHEDNKIYSGKISKPIKTSVGNITIIPTENYKNENIKLQVIKNTLPTALRSYESRLRVDQANEKSTVINLSFSDQNRERADDVLNTLVTIYNENWIQDKNQVAVSTSEFINDRLGVIENELGHVDSDISSYKSANLVPDVEAAASSYLTESQTISQELTELTNQLQIERYVRSRLTSEVDKFKVLPMNTGIEDQALQNQIKEYNDLILRRNALLSKSSERNPVVVGLDNDVNDMRNAIIGAIDNSIAAITTQIAGLQTAKGRATSRLASNPSQAKYLLSVERQQKVKENLYLFLLQKREDNELTQAFTDYNCKFIKKPGGTGKPTAPSKMTVLIACMIIGMGIPFSTIYIRELLNTKIRGRKDVEELKVPLIGEIPLDKIYAKRHKSESDNEIVVHSGSRDIINEAFRVLRTNLEFTKVIKDGCNVIGITSFNPGSGKSFISMNLAACMSLKKQRILVIDGDMRRRTVSQYVGNPNKGLADYLAGHIDSFKKLIVTCSENSNLFVLPVGSLPPNPTELIESPRFSKMIDELRQEYDCIIIDCPPIEVVADSQIIDQVADRSIFVIRVGLFERSMVGAIDNLYKEKKYKHMSLILNGTNYIGAAYGKSSAYGYGSLE